MDIHIYIDYRLGLHIVYRIKRSKIKIDWEILIMLNWTVHCVQCSIIVSFSNSKDNLIHNNNFCITYLVEHSVFDSFGYWLWGHYEKIRLPIFMVVSVLLSFYYSSFWIFVRWPSLFVAKQISWHRYGYSNQFVMLSELTRSL